MSEKPARRCKRVSEPDGGYKDIWVWHCYLCDLTFDTEYEFKEHLSTESHAFRWCLQKFEKKRKKLIKERHGVCIEVQSQNKHNYARFKGVVEVNLRPFEACKVNVSVVNLKAGVGGGGGGGPEQQLKGRTGPGGSGERGPVILHRIVPLVDGPVIKDANRIGGGGQPVELPQGTKYDLTVEIGDLDVSVYRFPIVFVLQPKSKNKLFYIVRELLLQVSIGEELVHSPDPEYSPFQGLEWGACYGTYEALEWNGEVVNKIRDFSIPMDLISLFASGVRQYKGMMSETQQAYHNFKDLTSEKVTRGNYANFFHALLHYDEFEAMKHIEKFNMFSVSLRQAGGGCVELLVPGLEEKRPSLLENDLVYIRYRHGLNAEEVDSIQYEGKIIRITMNTVLIQCLNGLTALVHPEAVFDVRFGLNRFPWMVKHRAIDELVERDLLDYVFPEEDLNPIMDQRNLPEIRFFNENVKNNPEQKQAVINILMASSMPAPYIVFGPPGTGKTITIVEAIMQVHTMCKNSVILVCAPSNSACDLLTERLLKHCNKDEIYRVHSKSRDIESIPGVLYPCSNVMSIKEGDKAGGKKNVKNNSIHDIGSVDRSKLGKSRIICCTLISAGKLSHGWIGNGTVTHVFIDECGQAVEPEAVAAVAGLLCHKVPSKNKKKSKKNGVNDAESQGLLVLAGDPLQLGPVCASDGASKMGLGMSLLERLMKRCALYQRKNDAYNPLFITKLVRNFRSHPDILLLPNELFYDNELEAHANVMQDPLCRPFSVHFHSVLGGDEREGSSPSYFNLQEVEVVLKYIKQLLSLKGASKVTEKDIGVLSPYTRQVHKLKQALRKKNWTDIEVGSTEIYQGREKRIMIISTVRSAKSSIEVDSHYRMGFLTDPKRFNVALTRAMARLIIIGDPYVLSRNKNWMSVIDLAQTHKTFVGAPYIPRDDNFVKRLHSLFKQMTIKDE
ncbi:putative helicase mov-10-B.1 [Ischnura elegans]|uniref:putative helicase mov-10-B.1 n=1 Tax=Ischnura elegans TaxID=197161 RepID=UPI001ED8A5E6|nr:putative helicase mov-10-B.1 [Ischnura elegans]